MNDDVDKQLSDLLNPGSTLMVGTPRDSALEFRPLTVARVEDNRIEILTDSDEEWVRTLNDGDTAYLTMSDTRSNTWLSLRGVVSITNDNALIDELWNPLAGAYFDDGRDTPGIVVLSIDGKDGRYWSTPSGRLGSVISIIKAKFGDPQQSGEHGSIAL